MITDTQIKNAIYAVLAPAVAPAVVFKRWELGFTPERCADLLRNPNDLYLGVPRIHAWMMTREADQPQQLTGSKFFEFYRYRLWAFHSLEPGPDGANSEDRFITKLEGAKAALRGNQTLGLAGQLVVTEPLAFREIDTYPLGEELVHVAKGALVVRVTTQI
jgi:hypothetical protein